ncbi:NADH-quinone oxidoreductase subunit L [Pseudidiomarina halophila]|uniref:Probable inorganic carbon transporter subunit DabB n=1 Tax=Pseudidiomarina halophila TaxID=1449799 RepID=A0A432Y111_9GAMM|nr:NADH-quinone oxidoreductase subunit L [Pseudidiomarina halophila]RUO54650.1 NADH-quinone oxidoreductase subunit L [Pseudidiomarina halophila]
MRWRITASILAVLSLGFLSVSLVTGIGGAAPFYAWGFGLTPLSAGFAAMISFIGFVVVRFAAVQMRDEHEGKRFHCWLTAVLAAILFTAVSDHFLLFWLGWVSVSLSLHRLLLFYPERPRAQLAAHKKFIFARLAETSLGAALFGLWWQFDILHISELSATPLADSVSASLLGSASGSEWIAILLVIVALLKCAQLPMHGWLLQVVEAPTAVSALLHAGIINLGGFLLLQFSPLLTDAPVARWLLAVVAGISMLVAATVTMTRISVKVRLAWSTVAQMALMLVEISLGYYTLAALHLLAHSCYKAYAFLTSGSAVEQRERQRFVQLGLPPFAAVIGGVLAVVGLVTGFVMSTTQFDYVAPWLAVSLALGLWLSTMFERFRLSELVRAICAAAVWFGVYLVAVWALSQQLNFAATPYLWQLDVWICMVLLGITGVYLWLLYRPQSAHSSRLFVALNAGLYLDEWATRLTLSIWPLRTTKSQGVSS